MKSLNGVNEENFYELTNMFKVQMENVKSKIVLLLVQIATGLILIVPMLQIKDMPDEKILKIILNITFGVYSILSIFAVGIIVALVMKKKVDILVNISGVFSMICICVFFYLVQITDIIHENYKYIFVAIVILTMIISIVNGLIYYSKTKKKLIKGVYKKGNYRYKFNKKILLALIPLIPMAIPVGNRGRVIEMVFGELYLLLGMNYLILVISIVFSYFIVNRIFFIQQLKLNKGAKEYES